MANKITAVKVKIKNDVATAKMVFSHPMMTYNQAKAKTGNREDSNFIEHITGKVGDEVVLDISTSQFFSKNPIFKFKFKCDSFKVGAKLSAREKYNGATRSEADKGDLLTIVASDRKGNTYEKSVELASKKKRK